LIFVNPAAGFDVDLLAGSESDFEYVAVAVQPEDAVAAMGDESIDEEAGTAHEHVGDAFDAGEGVVELIGGGEKLMLADVGGSIHRASREGPDRCERPTRKSR